MKPTRHAGCGGKLHRSIPFKRTTRGKNVRVVVLYCTRCAFVKNLFRKEKS